MSEFRVESTGLAARARERLLAYIAARDVTTHPKLPREEELAQLLGVSRTTVRTALNDLANQGVITRRQGRGTFVNAASLHMKVPFNPVLEFSDMIRRSGYHPSVELLGTARVPHDEAVAAALRLPTDTELIVTEKVFRADGAYCALCVDYFPAALIGGDDALAHLSAYEDSVFRFLAAVRGQRIVRDHVQIGAVTPQDVIRHLPAGTYELPPRPLLLLEGVNYDEDDRPVMVAREYIDPDLIHFTLIRERTVDYSTVQPQPDPSG